jgi:sugar phosphate isomerase/epimerase
LQRKLRLVSTFMRLTLCNEVVRDLAFERQCAMAAALGYAGLEIAPFTLGEEALRLPAARRSALRRACCDAGIAVSGLHWLLVAPPGLSITTCEEAVWSRTVDVMHRLIDLCADLGGSYLVHGSPEQRRIASEPDRCLAARRGEAAFAAAASRAATANVTYLIEPLAAPHADFITSIAEAARIVRNIASPAVKTMLDTRAASLGEHVPADQLLRHWLPSGLIAHVHLNDRSGRAPGQGKDQFGPVLEVLCEMRYAGWIGVEPFEYVPDGPLCAARAIGYVQGLLQGIGHARSS